MPTKDEKLVLLKEQIENFKKSLQTNSFDRTILESNQPKKDRIRAWGETLEKIFFLEGRSDEIDSISTIISLELKDMGLQKAIIWAKQSLPNKYKDASMIRRKRLLRDDELPTKRYGEHIKLTREEIAEENKPIIDDYRRTVRTLNKFIEKLHEEILLPKLDLDEYDELSTRMGQMDKLLNELMDNRDKVLSEKLHLMIYAYSQTTKSDAFSKYMTYMNKVTKLTPKQGVKLLTGRVSKVELLYEPQNLMEARHNGFYGKACDECGSWRIDLKYNPDAVRNMLYCYACKEWGERTIDDLMEKTL